MLEKRFIGVKELAEYLGIKDKTVYTWVHMRKIPYVKMGGLVKFDLKKIEKWVKEREVEAVDWDDFFDKIYHK